MPQAPESLRQQWTHESAYEELRANFVCQAGVFMPKVWAHEVTPRESSALDYLFLEWDYGFESLPCPLD